jgi:hypothetical protein
MGIDATVFTKVVSIFNKRYPDRVCDASLNELVPLLEKLDELFKNLPHKDNIKEYPKSDTFD